MALFIGESFQFQKSVVRFLIYFIISILLVFGVENSRALFDIHRLTPRDGGSLTGAIVIGKGR